MYYTKRFTMLSGFPIIGDVYNTVRKTLSPGNTFQGFIGLFVTILAIALTGYMPTMAENLMADPDVRSLTTLITGGLSISMVLKGIAKLPSGTIMTVTLPFIVAFIGLIFRRYSPYVKGIMDGSQERGAMYYTVCAIIVIPLTISYMAAVASCLSRGVFLEVIPLVSLIYIFILIPLSTSLLSIAFGIVGLFNNSVFDNLISLLGKAIPVPSKDRVGGFVLLLSVVVWIGSTVLAIMYNNDADRYEQNVMVGYTITCLVCVGLFFALHYFNTSSRTRVYKSLFFTYTKRETVFSKKSSEEIEAIKENLKVSFFVCGANVGAMTYVALMVSGISFDNAFLGILSFAVAAIVTQGICALISNLAFEEISENRIGVACGIKPLIYIAPTIFLIWGGMNL